MLTGFGWITVEILDGQEHSESEKISVRTIPDFAPTQIIEALIYDHISLVELEQRLSAQLGDSHTSHKTAVLVCEAINLLRLENDQVALAKVLVDPSFASSWL